MTEPDPALSWAAEGLDEAGWTASGEVEIRHDRPWALVVRMATDHGDAWLKVNRAGTTYEAAVMAMLAAVAPDMVLHPLAVDVDRGWSLNPDGGATLRSSRGEARPDPGVMGEVLRGYAALQRATADHLAELVAEGVPDLRPHELPALLDDLIDDADWSLIAEGEEADPTARARVMAHREVFAARCAELGRLSDALGIPMTLQHDDLHDNNVFVTPTPEGTSYRVFDWGDSCVSHPFTTLLVALRSFAAFSEVPLDNPLVHQVRSAYLDAWADLAPRAELERMADLAIAVGPVCRAHSWRNALTQSPPTPPTPASTPPPAEFADAVPGWLAELVPLAP